jgi:SnoaL-like domain
MAAQGRRVHDHGRNSEMAEQRVPNLEEMDEQEAKHFLAELFSHLSPEEEYNVRHQDYTMEMPQSGERIRGRENMRAFQEAYPNPPNIKLHRVLVREGLWVAEGVNDYGGGQVFTIVAIIELKDGKMWRDTRYYGEPFEAPEWRSQWAEQMER